MIFQCAKCHRKFVSQPEVHAHWLQEHPDVQLEVKPITHKLDAQTQTELFNDEEQWDAICDIFSGDPGQFSVEALTKEDLLKVLSTLITSLKELQPLSWTSVIEKTKETMKPELRADLLIEMEKEEVDVDPLILGSDSSSGNSHRVAKTDSRGESSWCKICNKKYLHLNRHFREFHNKKWEAKCEECQEVFRTTYQLKFHVNSVHKGMKVIDCEHCSKKFTKTNCLWSHMRLNHPQELKKKKEKAKPSTECSVCHKKFLKAENLKRHVQGVHMKQKNFSCEVCGMAFFLKQYLQKHIISVHENVRAFKCEKCSRSFKHNTQLKRHVREVHDGVKEYQCQFCGKEFAQAGNMRSHLEKHHNSR